MRCSSRLSILLLAGCVSRLPEDELRRAGEDLERYLLRDAMTRSEMNIVSEFRLELLNMERYLIEYRIWNQPGYDKIEKAFMADCEAWKKRVRAEAAGPGEFEGGSMAPLDHNMRMADFVRKRIDELKAKWRK